MSYRPITDMWILARAKLKGGKKYYGAYLGGFPERARALLGCKITEPVLHVCGGCAKDYPYKRAFGPNDKTLDLDPSCDPDFLQDAREPFPHCPFYPLPTNQNKYVENVPWAGILIDPPYTEQDAKHYAPGADKYPNPNLLIKNALEVLPIGGRVGIICYYPPKPQGSIFVACVGVISGFCNRIRCYSVYEKIN
ncbi:MAG TPA: hypothetical protein PLC59_00480 [Bacteroidales bacterium]|jgi:hypothetical protein|nr:hypothetical protein [Bacteroidales bacterium]HQI44540.1 hypothetical protein [Bacteroidales bacterium]